MEVRLLSINDHPREEMTAVVVPRPGDGIAPTLFSRLGNHAIIYFERQVILSFERGNGLHFKNK